MHADGKRQMAVVFLDHGTGIPKEIMHKIKEPFFSTKPRGVGTGLGLSISHGIMSDHGGELNICSNEGLFTKVEVILPVEHSNDT
jgi:signal transduction histidine kinase